MKGEGVYFENFILRSPYGAPTFFYSVFIEPVTKFFARFQGVILPSGAQRLRKGLRKSTSKVEHTKDRSQEMILYL